jgi:hypothetical protein
VSSVAQKFVPINNSISIIPFVLPPVEVKAGSQLRGNNYPARKPNDDKGDHHPAVRDNSVLPTTTSTQDNSRHHGHLLSYNQAGLSSMAGAQKGAWSC